MPEKLVEAAMLAVAGVAMVMAGLTVLMLAVMVLCRLVPGDKEKAASKVLQEQGLSKESIAAMAVAMALAMEEQKTGSTIGLDEAPVPRPLVSPWSAAGRERLMRSRTKTGHKWRRR